MTKYEFAIQVNISNNGSIIRIPVYRRRSGVSKFIPGPWNRITKIYDKYIAMELDFIPELTEQDCKDHIDGYRKVLMSVKINEPESIEYQQLETTEI